MKRRHLVELGDLPWWPRVFRDAATDYLVTAIRVTKTYIGLAPRLAAALKRSGATQITDLCSGGGGPWEDLLPAVRAEGADVSLCLTDLYPNTAAWAKIAASVPGVLCEAESVSATDVPERLTGFHTLFTAFHHFRPADAREILAAAVRDRQGIAIFEGTSRAPVALAMMLVVPAIVWLMTPVIRPFGWSRLFWTYVVPIIPVAVLFDGIVSTLRTYTPDELAAMAREVASEEYDWEAGFEYAAGSPIPLPFLIGTPRRPEAQTRRPMSQSPL